MSLKKDHAGKGGAGKNRAGRMKLTDRLHRPAPRTENVSIDTYDACVDFPILTPAPAPSNKPSWGPPAALSAATAATL